MSHVLTDVRIVDINLMKIAIRIMNSNVKGAFFLSQALYPALAEQRGAIVNLVDIYGERPLPQHPVYSMAKAALAMMTRSLAVEMAPAVRVNGIAPGAILPPVASDAFGEEEAKNVRERVPLQRWGGAAEPEFACEHVLPLWPHS